MPVTSGYLYAAPGGNGVPYWHPAWGDAIGNVEQTIKNGYTLEAYRDTGHVIEFNKHNLDSTLTCEIQLNHDWEIDTLIRAHIHIIPMANGAGDVYWTYQYNLCPVGDAIPAVASWTTGTTTTSLVAGDQYKHLKATIFELTPSGGSTSSILLFDITRASTNLLDTYDTDKDHGTAQANLGIMYVDVHYQRNAPGTLTEFV